MSSKTRPTRQRPGASSGASARKTTSTAKSRSGENPFKKAAAGIQDTTRAANANATESFAKATDKAAATAKSAARQTSRAMDGAQQEAFEFGKQFTQATDWMRNQGESFQNIWQQALQGVPAMASMGASAFGKQDGARNGASSPYGMQNPMFSSAMMDASQFSRAGGNASRSMQEMMALGSEQMQTITACATTTAGAAKDMSQELLQTANSLFADQMELTKAALSCRNVDDVMELQGKASRLAMETMFNESLRLFELASKYAVDIAEPVQQSFAHAGERMTKIVGSNAA